MKLHFVFADVQDTYELNMFPGAGVPLQKSVVTIELTPEQTERLPRKVRLVEIIPDPGEVDPA